MSTTRKEFEVHRLNGEGMKRAQSIALSFSSLLNLIETDCSAVNDDTGQAVPGDPRLLAVVRTKLEEACFFSKKAMASQKAHQQEPTS